MIRHYSSSLKIYCYSLIILILLLLSLSCTTSSNSKIPLSNSNRIVLKPTLNTDQQPLNRPVWFEEVPGQSNLFVALEQFVDGKGRIVLLNNQNSTQKVLHEMSVRTGNEEGLLGLAFHPRFTANGKYYVYYLPKSGKRRGVIEERIFNTSTMQDANISRVILNVLQPASNHNGGCLQFGSDGFLYIGLGDGGRGGDPFGTIGNGQDPSTLLGSILRIDVNSKSQGKEYAIPSDNPFVGSPSKRPEIYAYGLRNPWRFSFDPVTKNLWVGDVGQGEREEINLVQKGDNLGWKQKEGFLCYDSDNCPSAGLVDPVVDLDRSNAKSITGGYVFRAKTDTTTSVFSSGSYIFGDYVTKNIWQLVPYQEKKYVLQKVGESPQSISSFGKDLKGNLYVIGHEGTIYQIIQSHSNLALNKR
jgi:glucose/arabinose dehydrogenase